MTYRPREIIPCTICGARSMARRLCRQCYYRLRKRGALEAHRLLGPNDVFWSRVNKSDSCWLWSGTKNGYGYGVFLLPGEKPVRAHRYAYELTNGPIPEGMVIMHACDNPACINPAHLSAASKAANNRDAVAKMRNAFGERNGRAKVSALQIEAIRADQRSQTAIARDYGIDQSHVSRIKSGARNTRSKG